MMKSKSWRGLGVRLGLLLSLSGTSTLALSPRIAPIENREYLIKISINSPAPPSTDQLHSNYLKEWAASGKLTWSGFHMDRIGSPYQQYIVVQLPLKTSKHPEISPEMWVRSDPSFNLGYVTYISADTVITDFPFR